ncbi:acyl-homoserine-lactone synthase [Vibrio chagasii]|nr:acyl-homoserine-lactone synthase [Vibrio chagasii]
MKDCAYYGAIIEHIESDSLMVQTLPCHPQAMPISDAIALSNLKPS